MGKKRIHILRSILPYSTKRPLLTLYLFKKIFFVKPFLPQYYALILRYNFGQWGGKKGEEQGKGEEAPWLKIYEIANKNSLLIKDYFYLEIKSDKPK